MRYSLRGTATTTMGLGSIAQRECDHTRPNSTKPPMFSATRSHAPCSYMYSSGKRFWYASESCLSSAISLRRSRYNHSDGNNSSRCL